MRQKLVIRHKLLITRHGIQVYGRDQLCHLDASTELKERKDPVGIFSAFGQFGIQNLYPESFPHPPRILFHKHKARSSHTHSTFNISYENHQQLVPRQRGKGDREKSLPSVSPRWSNDILRVPGEYQNPFVTSGHLSTAAKSVKGLETLLKTPRCFQMSDLTPEV